MSAKDARDEARHVLEMMAAANRSDDDDDYDDGVHPETEKVFTLCFYARQHICYSAYMLWQFRPSVCLSVTRVDQSKTAQARITQFSPYSSPIPLVFRG